MHAKVFNLNMFLDTKKNTKDSVGDTVYISSPFPHKKEYHTCRSLIQWYWLHLMVATTIKSVKTGQSLWPTHAQLSY